MSNVIIRGKSGATVPPRKFRWVQSGSGAAQLTITLVAAQLPTNTSDDGPTHIKYIEETVCLTWRDDTSANNATWKWPKGFHRSKTYTAGLRT